MKALRSILAFVIGAAVSMFFIVLVEGVNESIWPWPAGVDKSDMKICLAYFVSLPATAFVIGVVGWSLAALCGPWVATRLGTNRHPAHGIALGVLLMLMALFNMSMLPYPLWFWAAILILLPTSLILGSLNARSTLPPNPAMT